MMPRSKITGVDSKEDSESDPSNGYDPDITPTLPDEPSIIDPTPTPTNGFVDELTPKPKKVSFAPTVEYEPTATEPAASPSEQPATDTRRRSTRERKQVSTYEPSMSGKSYQYAATQLEQTQQDSDPRVVGMIMTQLSLKAALKTWGKDAVVAAESEMKQLHWRNSFRPV